jgi:hypothetical protein
MGTNRRAALGTLRSGGQGHHTGDLAVTGGRRGTFRASTDASTPPLGFCRAVDLHRVARINDSDGGPCLDQSDGMVTVGTRDVKRQRDLARARERRRRKS